MIDLTVWTPLIYGYESAGDTGIYNLYRAANVYADTDGLHIRAEAGAGEYISGWIDSAGKKSFLYGYFEARMRWANIPGIWGGFFLVDDIDGFPPEIDAGEVFGNDGKLQFQIRQPEADYKFMHSFGASLYDWHTYGFLWDAEKVVWYIDNKRLWSVYGHSPSVPMALFINLGMGEWQIPDDAKLPATLDVEYVKVWQ